MSGLVKINFDDDRMVTFKIEDFDNVYEFNLKNSSLESPACLIIARSVPFASSL